MKKLFLLALLMSASAAFAEPKKLSIDCEAWELGDPPEQVFVVEGKFAVTQKDANKSLEVQVGELVEACALIGDSANGSASIEARVFASKQGRSFPKYSLGVHGQSGYRLVAFPAKKELQLTKGEEVIKSIPFVWTSDTWLKLKIEAKKVADKQWEITAKAWPADGAEPTEPQFKHEDKTLKGQGKCSLWGTPFSGTPILFDDILVNLE